MSIEVAGEVLAEAVIANELGKSGEGASARPHQSCANCGTALTGRYCHQCGQVGHVHRSLLHMFEEFLHGIFHFDTKAWRTVPALIVHPGRLTRAYVDGQRARHVAPLPLFLFMIFLMFFTFSLTSSNGTDSSENTDKGQTFVSTKAQKKIDKKIEASRARVAELQASIAKLDEKSDERADLEAELVEEKARLEGLQTAGVIVQTGSASSPVSGSISVGPDSAASQSRSESKRDDTSEAAIHKNLKDNVPWLSNAAFEKKIKHALENKELALYKMKGAAAKFAILLMPISLPFLWLLFPFSRRFTMFDHAVFSLYSLCFMAGLMSVLAVLGALGWTFLVVMLSMFAPPIHMFAQLRGTYGLSKTTAFLRTIALLFVALCSLLVYGLLVVYMSM
ncbi:DUF3667 domain-containing protein [Roseateles microcysteis]|uniref:DUF3667 domain-containing protein n=1 Tax=Roseateles microcysteis TaxID=3119057 RepID=UPI002FE5982D